MEQYLVLDIGGTFVKYAVMDREAQFIKQGKVPVSRESEETFFEALEAVHAEVGDDYEGVAVSMPGRIDTAKGWAYTGGAFEWLREYPAAEKIGSVFGGKRAVCANDAKSAALAESWSGALADVDSGAVVVLGTGVGGGIVLNKQVWMGISGGAGELSWLGADFDAVRDLSSWHGSYMWTMRVSASSIVHAYEKAKNAKHGALDGVALFDAYEAGEKEAVSVIKEYANQMAAGILSLQCVLDLPRIAIGGGISARAATVDTVRAKIDEIFEATPGMPFSKPEVVRCRFGNEANLIGALAFYLQQAK